MRRACVQVEGKYGYDQWVDLVAKRLKTEEKNNEDNPTDGIMDMMKQCEWRARGGAGGGVFVVR